MVVDWLNFCGFFLIYSGDKAQAVSLLWQEAQAQQQQQQRPGNGAELRRRQVSRQ